MGAARCRAKPVLRLYYFMEFWKEIKDLDGYYISNYGKVKGVEVKTKFGRQWKVYPERFVKTWPTPTGYHYVKISINGNMKTRILHRLVAIAFIPNPENKPQVNHIDGDKNNNLFTNLEWCTAAENLQHARSNGLNNSIGCDNKNSKFKKEDVIFIRNSSKPMTDLAIDFNVSVGTISTLKSRKTYKNV